MAKNFTSSYDFACAPLFVYGITELHRGISAKGVFRPLAIIGRYSLIMWFLHCVFFNTCRSFTQPILFFPRNPIAVLAWGLALCLAAAALLRFPTDAAVKLKNRLLKL